MSILALDKKTEVCQIEFVHIDHINSVLTTDIRDKIHEAGTYLGKTKEKIGVSDGAHLHLAMVSGGSTRSKMWNCLKGE